jgi:mannose-6-phosphate isomerase-like protein (cupin superfamily)
MADWTKTNLREVHDSAADHGFSEIGTARFPRGDLNAVDTGLAFHSIKPGKRQAFGHHHDEAEEIAVVVSGSGRVNVDGEEVELQHLDALRLAPAVTRCFEAGPDGMEILVFGPHHERDGEIKPGWWGG